MFEKFLPVLLILAVAAVFAAAFLGISFWLGPRKPDETKESTYECGIPVRGNTQIRFFVRFFLIAVFFLLFDLEAVFLYPWMMLFNGLQQAGHGLFALGEMGAFVFVLLVGFVYIWKKGGLEWQ